MKRLTGIFLLLTIISGSSLFGQEKRALLIGIGEYAPETGWHQIHGDKDVALMKSVLLRNGFEEDNISTLINEEATFSAIDAAILNLITISRNNDVIFIQFSGHGQQITDKDGDEDDGMDESWVPYDAFKSFQANVYEGERHFTDDLLFGYMSRLRKRIGSSGKLVIISDACHSGSGSRGNTDDDDIARGTDEKFIIPNVSPSKHLWRNPEDHVQWLFVGACKSYQTNYEHRLPEGGYCGSLTYVISHDSNDFTTTPYQDLISGWKNSLKAIAKFPQAIDEEGRPNRKSQYLF